jgi:hypothetical protein
LQTGNNEVAVDEDIVDGEFTLRDHQKSLKIEEISLDEANNHEKSSKEIEIVPQFVTPQLIRKFFTNYLPVFLPFLIQGINDWTNESKMMYINSLKILMPGCYCMRLSMSSIRRLLHESMSATHCGYSS